MLTCFLPTVTCQDDESSPAHLGIARPRPRQDTGWLPDNNPQAERGQMGAGNMLLLCPGKNGNISVQENNLTQKFIDFHRDCLTKRDPFSKCLTINQIYRGITLTVLPLYKIS